MTKETFQEHQGLNDLILWLFYRYGTFYLIIHAGYGIYLKKKVPTVYVQNEINVLLDNYMLSALLQFKSAWNKFLLDVSGCIGVPK